MFLTERKLERRAEELKEYRYRDGFSLEEFLCREDTQGVVNPEVPAAFDGWDVIRVGDTWKGRDKYLWLHREVTLPAEWAGRQALCLFDFGNTGVGNNSGFEALCYRNAEPYQGVDVNHQEVFFREEEYGKPLELTFRLWSGLEGGGMPQEQEHRINRAEAAWLDEKTDDLYYMASVVLETIRVLPETEPVRHALLRAMDEAFHCIDWSYPGSAEFYESVYQADALLNERVEAMGKQAAVHVSAIGHTHIDLAWLWRLKHTREKASRSFSTVMRLMERFPEYLFLQTQMQLYDYVKQDFPELYEQIRERVKEGRWEAEGAMWVEADCNLTSGESLTRQLLQGGRFLEEEFGVQSEYLWLPDVFGYSWALPQILKKSGIDTFMTTKISWNQYNRMPHDTFLWKGIDGTEVLTHFITSPPPDSQPGSFFYTYNGQITPKVIQGLWESYSEKDMNQDLLIAYGFGDGGGGVNRDMLERRRRIEKIPGLPELKTEKAGSYFRRLQETVKNTDQFVPVWDGELYLEYHRGTYTSQGYNKRMNRKLEFLYRKAEWLTAMEGIVKGGLEGAKQERLTEGWKQLLTYQFHDIIPGSAIREVYEDCREGYPRIRSIAEEVEASFYRTAGRPDEMAYTVLNASNWQVSGTAAIPNDRLGHYTDDAGRALPSQRAEGMTYVSVKEVPAMGTALIHFIPDEEGTVTKTSEEETAGVFRVDGKEIETPYYRISLNEYGQIKRLYDRENHREVLPEGERANVLQMFEDKPLDNDAWDIDIFYQQKMREVTELTRFETAEAGPVRLVLRLQWRYMNSVVDQDMVCYAQDRRIDFITHVDYHERQQLMKAAFPVDVRSTYASYDIQYGNVRRPNHWNTSWEMARFESVAHKWVDLSEEGYGVSLMNDCKYGHDVKDNVIRISLLRSGKQPDYLQDVGEHDFTYSLYPHAGGFVQARTEQAAFLLNQPLEAVPGRVELPFESFLAFDTDETQGVELDAVKKSEDGRYLVVRFHEFAGGRHTVKVKPGFPYRSWQEGDLRERPLEEASACGRTAKGQQEICLTVRPYELRTLLFTL